MLRHLFCHPEMAVRLLEFHEPGKLTIPSLLVRCQRIDPDEPQGLDPLAAIRWQLAALLKVALCCEPVPQATVGTLVGDFKMAVALMERDELVEIPIPSLRLRLPLIIPINAQVFQPRLTFRARLLVVFQLTLHDEPSIQVSRITFARNLKMTMDPVVFNEPVKLPVPNPLITSLNFDAESHGRLVHTNFFAMCSSKISCTVRATMTLWLRLKNASISVKASEE